VVEFNCLDGDLEVCRGFGDFDFVGMTATPSVLGPLETGYDFVILATDGLWDVLTDQEAVDFVGGYLARHQAAGHGSEPSCGEPSATSRPEPRSDTGLDLGSESGAFRGSAAASAGGSATLSGCSTELSTWAARRGSVDDITVVIVSLGAGMRSCSGWGSSGGSGGERAAAGAARSQSPWRPTISHEATPEPKLEPDPEPEQEPKASVVVFEVVGAERGGERTDEWLGDQLTLPAHVPPLEVLSCGVREQRWQWGGRELDVSFLRPTEDSSFMAPQYLVEMCSA
jgi:hypothetical protein